MNKRSSRVYVLLMVLSVIMFFSFIIDMTVPKSYDNIDSNDTEINENNDGILQVEEDTETTTEFVPPTLNTLNNEEKNRVENFYKNTVFVGDSIMLGFSTYASKESSPEFVKNLTFLAAASYGVDAAINNKGLMYKGQSQPVIDSLCEINPDKIFINLGVNELNGVSAEKVGAKYETLINNIHDNLPNSKIYVLGVNYFVKGKETDTYNNAGIKAYNDYLSHNATKWDVTYLDIVSKLVDSEGYLPAELSSDNRIHLNDNGYILWVNYLEELALSNFE
ncbi:MAG: GDSL-type esterase/lipase family protein [Lachnospirales bacterium]